MSGTFCLVFADHVDYNFVVKDDLTPGRSVDSDPVRECLLGDPRLAAVELLTTPASAAIVAVRLA